MINEDVPGLDIDDAHLAWDSAQDLRDRLRNGSSFMDPRSEMRCDNPTCCRNASILEPILVKMSCVADRKLPNVKDLRAEMSSCYEMNKRPPNDPTDERAIVADSWHIRKLLSHIKAKARRGEVSNEFWLH